MRLAASWGLVEITTSPHFKPPPPTCPLRKGDFSSLLGGVELGRVRAPAGHDGRATARGERHGLLRRVAAAEGERQPGRKAVAAAIHVDDGARHGRGPERTARLHPAAETA